MRRNTIVCCTIKKLAVADKPNESTNPTSNVESVLVLLQMVRAQVFVEQGRFEDTRFSLQLARLNPTLNRRRASQPVKN